MLVCWGTTSKADPKFIKKGQAVPTDGVFYSKDAHAKLVSKLQTQKKQCNLDKKMAVEKAKTESAGKIARLKIDLAVTIQKLNLTRESMSAQKKLLLGVIPKRNKQYWWKSTPFLFFSGVVAGIIVSGLATWGATEIVQKVNK